jgi:hypothetical protein
MLWGVVVGLCGLIFFILGIRQNKKIHKEEGFGSGVLGDSLIFTIVFEIFRWVFDKLPFWVTRLLFFVIAIFLFYYSYRLLN